MSFNIPCPLPATLIAPGAQLCPVDIGQVARLAVRRISARTSTAATNFTSVADILNKDKWTAAMAATDNTKIILTPYVVNFIIPDQTATTQGGNDNTTIDGIPLLTGGSSQTPTWRFQYTDSGIIKTLQSYTGYSLNGELEVFLIQSKGNIIYDGSNQTDPDDATTIVPQGFQIFNWFVGDYSSAGFNQPTINNSQFSFGEGWGSSLKIAAVTLEGTPAVWNARQLIA